MKELLRGWILGRRPLLHKKGASSPNPSSTKNFHNKGYRCPIEGCTHKVHPLLFVRVKVLFEFLTECSPSSAAGIEGASTNSSTGTPDSSLVRSIGLE